MEDYKLLNIVFASLTLAAFGIILLLSNPGINNVFSQPISSMNNSMPLQQHANHTFDNLIVSEHIPLIIAWGLHITHGLYSLRYQRRGT